MDLYLRLCDDNTTIDLFSITPDERCDATIDVAAEVAELGEETFLRHLSTGRWSVVDGALVLNDDWVEFLPMPVL